MVEPERADEPGPGRTDPESELDDARMPFLEHVRELRVRIRNAALALIGGFLVTVWFRVELYYWLTRPLRAAWQEIAATNPALGEPALKFKSLVEPFWTYFSIALWAGIFVAAPLIFYQLWKFIAPGLYKRERRWGVAFAACSALLFLAGALFCYFVVLEPLYTYLLGYASANLAEVSKGFGLEYTLGEGIPLRPELFMQEYLDLSRKMMLGFGLVFELPLVILFLSLAGVVTHRSLWKFNRWAILLAFIIGAILTPSPDVMSQVLMAGPMIVLYNLSIVISWVITIRRERAEAGPVQPDEPDEPDDDGTESGA